MRVGGLELVGKLQVAELRPADRPLLLVHRQGVPGGRSWRSGWCASYLGATAEAGATADPRDRASALGLVDLVASVTAAAAGILTGLLVGVIGVVSLTLVAASAMGIVLLIAGPRQRPVGGAREKIRGAPRTRPAGLAADMGETT